MNGYTDTLGRTVRDNLILARDFSVLAGQYELELAYLPHAAITAQHARSEARYAMQRCRSIIARRFEA